jgi:hypothetical protein
MRFLSFLCSSVLLAVAVTAQTHTINGKVEDVQNTQNQFYLDGTDIPLVSSALNLNAWVGQQAMLDVVDVGTPGAPVLRVDAAAPTTKIMDMGNLRLGETRTWEVFASAGSAAFIFMDWTDNTGFAPIPGFDGAYLLGAAPHFLTGGITNGAGVFQTTFTTPNDPGLVGLQISSQALVVTGAAWSFSNVDGKEIEP